MSIHNMRPGASRKGFRGLRGLRGRGLGTIAVQTAGGIINGSDIVARGSVQATPYRLTPRAVGPAWPSRPSNGSPITPAWGSTPRTWSPPYQSPSGGMNLAQLQQLAQSNPAALTPSQIAALQAAGTLPGTLPTTSGALISTGSGAIDPATGQTYASELASAQTALTTAAGTSTVNPLSSIIGIDPTTGATTVFGVDWYWLAGAAAALYFFTGRRRR